MYTLLYLGAAYWGVHFFLTYCSTGAGGRAYTVYMYIRGVFCSFREIGIKIKKFRQREAS